MHRKWLFIIILGVASGIIAWAVYSFKESGDHGSDLGIMNLEQSQKDFDAATRCIVNGDYRHALEIIHQYDQEMVKKTEQGNNWLSLLISCYEGLEDGARLTFIYDHFPDLLDKHEKAVLLISHELISQNRSQDLQKLRVKWKGRETLKPDWLNVDADAFLMNGRRDDAVHLLQSVEFPGKQDTPRLVRLALITMQETPKESLRYLSKAKEKDPKNAEVPSYQAKILETVGQYDLARLAYTTAMDLDPVNIQYIDDLAEFFHRRGQLSLALQLWAQHLNVASSEVMWIKMLFWSKVAAGIADGWRVCSVPDSAIKPYIDYLTHLPEGVFWDADAFEKLPNAKKILNSNQASFWLRFLDYLSKGKEKEALDMLISNPFKAVSWDPLAEAIFLKVLSFRKNKKWDVIPLMTISDVLSEEEENRIKQMLTQRHSFFREVYELDKIRQTKPNQEIPEEISQFLISDEAISAVLLASGWLQSAIALHKHAEEPKEVPEWYIFGLTQSLRVQKSPKDALEYASHQKQSDAIALLVAELKAELGQSDTAMEEFEKLSLKDGDVGFRAAYLSSLLYIEKKSYDKAKASIQQNPALLLSTLGKETLARIALLENNLELATRLYISIEKNSAEAKSFLARQALANKDFKKARQLTEELLQLYPNNVVIQMNLKYLDEEEAKGSNSVSSPSVFTEPNKKEDRNSIIDIKKPMLFNIKSPTSFDLTEHAATSG